MSTILAPQEFVAKWRGNTNKEKSTAQEHFIDLCRLIGHPTPNEADPHGKWFTFEAGAQKQEGGQGWADVWKKGFFAWEYKGHHGDLAKAYKQLLQYYEALDHPPLLIVSDLQQIIINTHVTNTKKQTYSLTLDDLLSPDKLQILRNAFTNYQALISPETVEKVTEDAAREFARLADLLRMWGAEPHAAAHFLIRLLFCLFAEDVGLLPNHVFTRLVETTRTQPKVFATQLKSLFAAMATGGYFGVEMIPHFNGGLFNDDSVLDLPSDGLEVLWKACALDWASIDPSILGTLFERSLDPNKRSQLGAHYTSRADIELTVEPVLMQPLRREWQEVQQKVQGVSERRERAQTQARKTVPLRDKDRLQREITQIEKEMSAMLMSFAAEIASTRILDPACGSGNFLYVALQHLHDLEKEAITYTDMLGLGRFFPSVNPLQLHGIEINPYARELAQATIWIGHLQWMLDNGFGEGTPPILKPLDTIVEMDAILTMSSALPHPSPARRGKG